MSNDKHAKTRGRQLARCFPPQMLGVQLAVQLLQEDFTKTAEDTWFGGVLKQKTVAKQLLKKMFILL